MTRPWGLLACQGSYIRRSAPIYLPIFAVQSKKVRSIPAPDILLSTTCEFDIFQWLLGWSTYWEKVAKIYKSTGIYQNRSLSSYELDWFKPTITFHVDIFNSSEHSRSTAKPTSRTVCLLKLVAWHAGLRHPKHPKETVGSCWHTHTHTLTRSIHLKRNPKVTLWTRKNEYQSSSFAFWVNTACPYTYRIFLIYDTLSIVARYGSTFHPFLELFRVNKSSHINPYKQNARNPIFPSWSAVQHRKFLAFESHIRKRWLADRK